MFGLQSLNKSPVQNSFRSHASSDETYDMAYQRLMERLESEARQKELIDRTRLLQLQLSDEKDRKDRRHQKQLHKAHAEILRRQSEDNHKKRLMQRSYDLSPGFDLSSFPLAVRQEKYTKSQKQQIMAKDLTQQMHDKQKKIQEIRHSDAEYDSCQTSFWKSQVEMVRLQEIKHRLKVKDNLTKSWSEDRRVKSIKRYLENDTKAMPIDRRLRELSISSQSPNGMRYASPDEDHITRTLAESASPAMSRSIHHGPIAEARRAARLELAERVKERIRQGEINSLRDQVLAKAIRLSSHSPTPSHHKKLLDEAAALLVSTMQTRVKNGRNMKRRKPHAAKHNPAAIKPLLSCHN